MVPFGTRVPWYQLVPVVLEYVLEYVRTIGTYPSTYQLVGTYSSMFLGLIPSNEKKTLLRSG
jgi:hypothetical protein